MCQEVFQIAMSMDLKSVEMQLALQCAQIGRASCRERV